MDYTALLKANAGRKSKVGVIGATRGYGYTLLAQLPSVELLSLRLICSRHTDECRAVLEELGYDPAHIRECGTVEQVKAAPETDVLIVSDYRMAMESDINALVECTGNTAISSEAALAALGKGINVYMVSKETDSVCGPLLNRVAAEKGAVYALVNGDQPRNLLDLYSWAKLLGLEIVAAGKSSEYDFIWDPDTEDFSYLGGGEHMPGMRDCWRYQGNETLEKRRKLLAPYMDVISADLCEMNLVSNVTGLVPARPQLNYPIVKISELADVFIPKEDGGVLDRTGVVDVFYNLRAPDEASFAGGEFLIVRCANDKVWTMLREKGHIVSRSGQYACLYLPYHYMGLETPVSIILGDFMGIGTHPECRQVSVMAGVALTDLPEGTVLKVGGHHHTIDGLTPELLEQKTAPAGIMPFYLLNNMKLTKTVKQGQAITIDAVDIAQCPTYALYTQGLNI